VLPAVAPQTFSKVLVLRHDSVLRHGYCHSSRPNASREAGLHHRDHCHPQRVQEVQKVQEMTASPTVVARGVKREWDDCDHYRLQAAELLRMVEEPHSGPQPAE
jgi:hypothetical protein